MAIVDKKSDFQQIIQHVLDEPSQSLKVALQSPVTVEFEGGSQEVEISAADGDNIAISDGVNTVMVTPGGRLAVETSGSSTVSGEVSIPPPTDFRVVTVEITSTPYEVSFSSFSTTSLIVKSVITTPGLIRVGKADVGTTLDQFYLLSPGEILSIPLAESGSSVYLVKDVGAPAGTYRATIFAVN
jgi:hypothetical protein